MNVESNPQEVEIEKTPRSYILEKNGEGAVLSMSAPRAKHRIIPNNLANLLI